MAIGDHPNHLDPVPVKLDVYEGMYLAKEHIEQLDRIEKMLKELIEAAKRSRLAP